MSDDSHPPSHEETEKGRKAADRRRYRILQILNEQANGNLTIRDLMQHRHFERSCGEEQEDAGDRRLSERRLVDDFRQINAVLGKNIVVYRENPDTLVRCAVAPTLSHESPFPGYASLREHHEKQQIGRFVVDKYLKRKDEVLYLSTGTTVYAVAQMLAEAQGKRVAVVLTDNLAIIDMFIRRLHDPKSRPIEFDLQVLGGRVDFATGDIVQDQEEDPLWRCSTAIMSATSIDPKTGQIYSYRGPTTKRRLVNQGNIEQFIIPVTPDKIGFPGGQLIVDPKELPSSRKLRLVTTRMADELKTHLSKLYDIDIVPADYGKAGDPPALEERAAQ